MARQGVTFVPRNSLLKEIENCKYQAGIFFQNLRFFAKVNLTVICRLRIFCVCFEQSADPGEYLVKVNELQYNRETLQNLPGKMIYHFTGLKHFRWKSIILPGYHFPGVFSFSGLSFYRNNFVLQIWVYHFTDLSFYSKFEFIILWIHFCCTYRLLHGTGTVLPSLLFEFELTGMALALPRRWYSAQCVTYTI